MFVLGGVHLHKRNFPWEALYIFNKSQPPFSKKPRGIVALEQHGVGGPGDETCIGMRGCLAVGKGQARVKPLTYVWAPWYL